MGTWGCGPFDNDDAGDLESQLSLEGKSVLEQAILGLNLRDLADDTNCAAAIAACEIIAAANGNPMRGFTKMAPEAKEWLKEQRYSPTKRLLSKSIKCVAAIRKNSALKDLWVESGDSAAWGRSLSGLLNRLEKPSKAAPPKPGTSLSSKKIPGSKPKPEESISIRQAKQLVRKKLGGAISDHHKNSLEIYVESLRRLSLKDARELGSLSNVNSLIADFVRASADKQKALETLLRGWNQLTKLRAGTSTGLAGLICRVAPDLTRLSELDLSDTEVCDRDIRLLSGSRSLESINLGRTMITGKSLNYLTACPKLKLLNLYRCEKLTTASVNRMIQKLGDKVHLNYFPSAKQLGIKELTPAQKKSYDQRNKKVTSLIDQDWDFVWINLHYGEMGIGQLIDMERLSTLARECEVDSLEIGLNQSKVVDEYAEGLRFVMQAWPSIRSLSITKSQTLNDSFVDLYQRYRKLKSLSFQDVDITDKTVIEIIKLPALVRLGLVRTNISKKSLTRIAKLPKLKWLTISPGNDVTLIDLKRLQKKLIDTCYVKIVRSD